MTLKLVSKKKGAFWVSVDGQQLPQFIVRDGWEAAESGWYYNLPDRTIWVKFAKRMSVRSPALTVIVVLA